MLRAKLLRYDSLWRWLYYVALSLVVLAPLLKRGYVLAYEMVFTPTITLPSASSSTYPFYVVLRSLAHVIPVDILQKILLLSIFVFAGVGMHRLVANKQPRRIRSVTRKTPFDIVRLYGQTSVMKELKGNAALPSVVAGTFYILNPFTYAALVSGEYMLLAGYALFPWLIHSLFLYINRPSGKRAALLGVWYTVVAMFSVHVFLLAVGIFVIASIAYSVHAPQKVKYFNAIVENGLLALLLFAVINSYWFNRVVRGATPLWPVHMPLHELSFVHRPFVWLLLAVMAGVIVWGIRRRLSSDTPQAITLILSAIVSAAGLVKSDILLVPLVLAAVYFLAHGMQVITEKLAKERSALLTLLPALFLLFPIAITPRMVSGYEGKIAAVSYPASWLAFKRVIDSDPHIAQNSARVLFAPRQNLVTLNFSPSPLQNPGELFFGPATTTTWPTDFSHVKYILVAHGADWESYIYLANRPDLQLISDDDSLIVYRNSRFRE